MSVLTPFIASEGVISVSGSGVTAVRSGFRSILKDDSGSVSLSKHLSGQLPYYYRKLESIVEDFESKHDALDLMLDLMGTAPNSPKFRASHGGEILAAHYIEQSLKFRQLYSKLTLTTSEDTNAHKMDALFVNTEVAPYQYTFVEAKSSILPTEKTKTKTHRSGILKAMVESLNNYSLEEPRMEFIRIRENLDTMFNEGERKKISQDLRGTGPPLNYIGISITNADTVNVEDDEFILSETCNVNFKYYALVVTDLKSLTSSAYGLWDSIKAAVEAAKKC